VVVVVARGVALAAGYQADQAAVLLTMVQLALQLLDKVVQVG
jgi:hypothetical protein